MPNRLAGETSPYLLQHANNPVDWFPWGPDALARAKLLDRPIFLSIGYAACHWCHVMERESFEHEPTARYLNDHFVAIKVDREERPDLDQVYMAAVQAMTGGGGWPMSVFLTPEGRPFYGGTYFPDEPRHGMPSFRQVLEGVDRTWRDQRAEVEGAGSRLVAALVDQQRIEAGTDDPTPELFETVANGLIQSFDSRNGSWGGAPKFPQPMTIDYLLRRLAGGDMRFDAVIRFTLDKMADGGIHDQLGGGFHRYSTDPVWLVPHFEQMLYDNAQLARVYLHAWAQTGEVRYRDVATGTLDYMIRELTTADGAFAASQDADTDGIEGLTFVWTAAEIREVLGDDAEPFLAAYGVTDEGNWEGRTILSRVWPDIHTPPSRDDARLEASLAASRARLLARRSERPQPARDDKALAAWNGLAIAAFADAARLLRRDDPDASERYRAAAVRAAETIAGGLLAADGSLSRSWKDGRATGQGVLEDYTPPGRRPARALRGDVRRALVHDGPGADGSRARAVRRSGRRVLRHRRRPRAARDPAQGPPGQRGPVRECRRDPGPAPPGGVDGREPVPRCRRASLADRGVVRRSLSDGLRPVALGDGPGAGAGGGGRDRRRPGRPGHPGARRRRRDRASGRTRSWPSAPIRRRASCRCWPTASRSMAARRPMSATASCAACRSPRQKPCRANSRRARDE